MQRAEPSRRARRVHVALPPVQLRQRRARRAVAQRRPGAPRCAARLSVRRERGPLFVCSRLTRTQAASVAKTTCCVRCNSPATTRRAPSCCGWVRFTSPIVPCFLSLVSHPPPIFPSHAPLRVVHGPRHRGGVHVHGGARADGLPQFLATRLLPARAAPPRQKQPNPRGARRGAHCLGARRHRGPVTGGLGPTMASLRPDGSLLHRRGARRVRAGGGAPPRQRVVTAGGWGEGGVRSSTRGKKGGVNGGGAEDARAEAQRTRVCGASPT